MGTIKGNGLLYQPMSSSCHPALHITDADFPDDIALLSDNLTNAQALLCALELAAISTGLYLNETKPNVCQLTFATISKLKLFQITSSNVLETICI